MVSKPFDDVRVRKALAYAIDRQSLIDGAMFGYGTLIGSHFAPHNPAYLDLSYVYDYNPEKAKALLKEAGLEKWASRHACSCRRPTMPVAPA